MGFWCFSEFGFQTFVVQSFSNLSEQLVISLYILFFYLIVNAFQSDHYQNLLVFATLFFPIKFHWGSLFYLICYTITQNQLEIQNYQQYLQRLIPTFRNSFGLENMSYFRQTFCFGQSLTKFFPFSPLLFQMNLYH